MWSVKAGADAFTIVASLSHVCISPCLTACGSACLCGRGHFVGFVSCESFFDGNATFRCTGDGDCECFPGWYGSRCDMSTNSSCVIDTDCGGPEQGTCVSNVCVCSHGHAGPHCDPCEENHYGSCHALCEAELNCSKHGRSEYPRPGSCPSLCATHQVYMATRAWYLAHTTLASPVNSCLQLTRSPSLRSTDAVQSTIWLATCPRFASHC